jgi:hypothetical protein
LLFEKPTTLLEYIKQIAVANRALRNSISTGGKLIARVKVRRRVRLAKFAQKLSKITNLIVVNREILLIQSSIHVLS